LSGPIPARNIYCYTQIGDKFGHIETQTIVKQGNESNTTSFFASAYSLHITNHEYVDGLGLVYYLSGEYHNTWRETIELKLLDAQIIGGTDWPE